MPAQLNLARAAQLVGLPRATLQRMIRDGELISFDGALSIEELQRVFPETSLEDTGLAETVRRIREESFGRRIRERALPSQEILAQRIFEQSEELTELRRHLQQYHALLQSVLNRLDQEPPSPARELLQREIESGLARILASQPDELNNSLTIMHDMLKMISAQVTLRPSGREFLVEGNDTLLQAGLKAGLRLNYGCGSGSCGLCKTRIVSGEVRQTGHADYVLSEAERASGHVLSCVCTPVTDIVAEALEAAGPQDIPAQEIVATVHDIRPPAAAGAPYLLHLQTPRSNRLRFLAGQSVTLGLRTPGGDVTATWPIASCPCDDRNLHFHLPSAADGSEPDDALARALAKGWLKKGTPVNLRGPLGEFTLDPESSRPLVFLCRDHGFGPAKSLIEHALAIDHVDTFGLIRIAAEGAHYLDNQCRSWADAYERFVYRRVIANRNANAANSVNAAAPRDPAAEGRQVLDEAIAQLPFLAEADVFIAGSAEFVAAILRHPAAPSALTRCRSCIV